MLALLDRAAGDVKMSNQLFKVLKGRYGPYIKSEGKNFKIPKDTDPETLDRAACEELIKAGPSKRRAKRK